MHLGDVLVLHLSYLLHQLLMVVQPAIILDEVPLEVHYVLVGWLLSAVDVDGSKVRVSGVLDEGQQVYEGAFMTRLGLTHAIIRTYNTILTENYPY